MVRTAGSARKLGADVAITGGEQKVSHLNLNVHVKQLSGSDPEKADSVVLRSDTDESSGRRIRFLVEDSMGAGT